MIRKPKNYDNVSAFTDEERLPVGGYVLKILGVDYVEGEGRKSDRLVLHFDIAEGDYQGFYKQNYTNQSGEDKKWKGNYTLWLPDDSGTDMDVIASRRLKTFVNDLEDSNPNYHWDWNEAKLKNKLIGGIFCDKQWSFNGRSGFFTTLRYTTSIQKIREGKFKIPDPIYLKGMEDMATQSGTTEPRVDQDGFMEVPDGTDEELPFS